MEAMKLDAGEYWGPIIDFLIGGLSKAVKDVLVPDGYLGPLRWWSAFGTPIPRVTQAFYQ